VSSTFSLTSLPRPSTDLRLMKDCPAIVFGGIKGKKKLQATVWRRKMVAAHLKITESQLIETTLLLSNEDLSPTPIGRGDSEVQRCDKIVTYVRSQRTDYQFSPFDHSELKALCYSRDLYNLNDLSGYPFDNDEAEDLPIARAEFFASSLTHLQLHIDEDLSSAISSFLPSGSPDSIDASVIERMTIVQCRRSLSRLIERIKSKASSTPAGQKYQRAIKNLAPPIPLQQRWEEKVAAQLRDIIVRLATQSSCGVMSISSHQASNQYLSILSQDQVTSFRRFTV
jgi:hypothetical protein